MAANENELDMYDFATAEAGRGKPETIRTLVKQAFRDGGLWRTVRRYMLPPGVCGSRQFDQANVVRELLAWDVKHGGGLITKFVDRSGISHRVLWNHIYNVLGGVFETHHGRVVGLLTHDGKGSSASNGDDIE